MMVLSAALMKMGEVDELEMVAPLRIKLTVPSSALSTRICPLLSVPLMAYTPGTVMVTVEPSTLAPLPSTVMTSPARLIFTAESVAEGVWSSSA